MYISYLIIWQEVGTADARIRMSTGGIYVLTVSVVSQLGNCFLYVLVENTNKRTVLLIYLGPLSDNW